MAATLAIAPEDEGFHPAGPEEQWSDSLYFGGGDGRGSCFYARVGLRPNERAIEGAFGLWLPDGRFLITFAREEAAGSEPRAGAVRLDCVVPLELWRIDLDGAGRLLERPEDLADRDRLAAAPAVTLRGRLRFCAWRAPIAFASGLTAAVAARHYEQPGSVAGVLEVGDERVALAGAGMRDHSWGVRDWQAVPYWRWMGMVVDPDTFVLVNNVGTPDGGETVGGCLARDGVAAPIVEGRTEGDRTAFVAWARDERGREAELRGEALSVAPLRQRRDGRLTLVNEVLTRLRWDGHERVAVTEWLEQG